MKKHVLIAVLSVAFAGCQSVPATKLGVNPQTGVVTLESPKEISISNLVVNLPNGVAFDLKGYQSHNSADVIGAVAASNAKMAEKYIEALQILQDMAKQGALKGATGGLAP